MAWHSMRRDGAYVGVLETGRRPRLHQAFKNALCLCPCPSKLMNCYCGTPSALANGESMQALHLADKIPSISAILEARFERRLGNSGSDRRSLKYAHDKKQARQTELGAESAPGPPPPTCKSVAVHGAAIALFYSSSTSSVS
jgi:hypothetical protein